MKNKKLNRKKKTPISNNDYISKPLEGDVFYYFKNLSINLLENKKHNSPEYFFSAAITAREEKEYSIERQAIINLLFYINKKPSPLIKNIISGHHYFQFTERTNFLNNLDNINYDCHDYYKVIISFIKSSTKQQVPSYFNCFMGKTKRNEELQDFFFKDISTLPDEVLLDFFEVTHRLLLDYSKNESTLEKLTLYINKLIKKDYSKTFLFFLSYFNLNSNDLYAIEIAKKYLANKDISLNIFNYSNTIAWNTALASLRLGNLDEAKIWCKHIEIGEDRDKIIKIIADKEIEITFRANHPLNPDNILPTYLDQISTKHLLLLSAYLHGCGDDWGFKKIKTHGKYIYPSQKITIDTVKELAIKGYIKTSKSDFINYSDDELNNFNFIISMSKFHLNINGVIDNKKTAFSILMEEAERRGDKYDAFMEIWGIIKTGYFFSSLEFYLSNIQDSWAKDTEINEKTIQRIENINISPQVLSYIAKTSVRFTAGKYSIGETYGDKNTKNILIGSINRNIDWLENGTFIDNSAPRYKNQPVLSIESIIEMLFSVTPDTIYNSTPNIKILEIIKDCDLDF
ncbi:hypothetical protein PHA77_02130 [Edwardsiella tarda]|uniref:hypothetical protein n=1 Tax=Edwardsiella tarda TaxID=636 RepID=UPI002443DF99|nr:hypothetical protein [Edwardsiella tarda]WGE29487.1 hypothetical protein PHA77_02130 [Edwardsiella tarda]